MSRTHVSGFVDGKEFKNGRKMVELIYRLFYNSHPSITLREFMDELSAYRVWPFNDANQRSFFKSEVEYNKLSSDLQKKFYDKTPFMMDGQKYYLKTETGEPETSEHIRFAEDHGISVTVNTSICVPTQVKLGQELPYANEENVETKAVEQIDSEMEDTNTDSSEDVFETNEMSKESCCELKVISINDLNGKHFYIPDYQRGYRWIDEAGEFIKDIQENTSDEYLLQPIVVKKMDDETKQSKKYEQFLLKEGDSVIGFPFETKDLPDEDVYELIDGQQRLTTLFLTLRACEEKPKFEIYYENERPLDNRYIELAKDISVSKLNGKKNKKDFSGALQKYARYIWYEDNTSRSAEEVFRSLNADKTELTSAELFKALMLNNSDEKKRRFWADRLDEMEIRLNDETLWRFMADNKYISNRIELVLNIYAHGLNKSLLNEKSSYKDRAEELDGDGKSTVFFDSRYAFLSLSNYLDWKKENGQPVLTSDEIGDAIYDIFETLSSWHRDYRTHNLIGFLIAQKGLSYEERVKMIYDLEQESRKKPFNKFVNYLYKKIKIENLENKSTPYEIGIIEGDSKNNKNVVSFNYHNKECYNILLLSNIICAIKGCSFFDFTSLKDKYNFKRDNKIVWDIEHINPKKPDENLLEIQKCGKQYYDYLSDEPNAKFNGTDGYYVYHQNTIISCLGELIETGNLQADEGTVINFLDKIKRSSDIFEGRCKCPDVSINGVVSKLWKNHVKDKSGDNSFSNLALLASDINRKYHNMPYGEKCLIVQHDDEIGHFIPTMTKRVFTAKKYVTTDLWDEKAREAYVADINKLLKFVKDKATP